MTEGITQGRVEGLDEGEKKMLELIALMVKNGLADQIPRLSEDDDFFRRMKESYHL